MDGDAKRRLPKPRAPKDNPAREYTRPPDGKLLDVSGLLIVLGLSFAGFVLALLMARHGL